MRELGLAPTLFCGGGWYTDVEVAEACAELGYVDCTPRARASPVPRARRSVGLAGGAGARPPARRSVCSRRSRRRIRSATSAAHSSGRGRCRAVVHVYFHDTDLADRRRRIALRTLLVLLARVAEPTDLERLADVTGTAPEVPWSAVARTT